MIAIFIWAMFCLGLAYWNYDLITNGKKIAHWFNGSLHLGAAIGSLIMRDWQTSLSVLLTARVVFDTALNAMRGLSFGYLGKGSFVDGLEKKIFKNGTIAKIVYVVGIVLLMAI